MNIFRANPISCKTNIFAHLKKKTRKYRMLRIGEKLRPTDQYIILGDIWRSVGKEHAGMKINKPGYGRKYPAGWYRRKIT